MGFHKGMGRGGHKHSDSQSNEHVQRAGDQSVPAQDVSKEK